MTAEIQQVIETARKAKKLPSIDKLGNDDAAWNEAIKLSGELLDACADKGQDEKNTANAARSTLMNANRRRLASTNYSIVEDAEIDSESKSPSLNGICWDVIRTIVGKRIPSVKDRKNDDMLSVVAKVLAEVVTLAPEIAKMLTSQATAAAIVMHRQSHVTLDDSGKVSVGDATLSALKVDGKFANERRKAIFAKKRTVG